MSMPERLGRLMRVRRVGAGGFASVWLYRDEQLDSYVAVKSLADNWAQQLDVRDRFLEEARVLRRAASHHVVEVHDFGETEDGTPYFVMTYADRGTVADLLGEGTPGLDVTVDLIEQACRGVADLHAAGVVHRDVKPPNLLLCSDRRLGRRLLVADLGLAKAMMYASGLTQIVGTPAYMAPEQGVPGGGVDERADVHALGAVAYHLLSGRPMRDIAIGDVGSAGPPEPLSRLIAVPPALDAAVTRAVQPDPADRWPSASAFANAVRSAVGEQPATQYAPPPGGRPPAGSGIRIESGTTQVESAATRVDTGATRLDTAPSRPGRSRRRTLAALLAAIGLVAAAGIAWLTLRHDDQADASGAVGASPSTSPPTTADPTETGPSSSPAGDGYCAKIVEAWNTLELIGTIQPTSPQFGIAVDTIHETTLAAPPDVVGAWRLIDQPFQDFKRTIEDLGLTWADLQEADSLTRSEQNAVLDAVTTLGNDVDAIPPDAGKDIKPLAERRCDIDL